MFNEERERLPFFAPFSDHQRQRLLSAVLQREQDNYSLMNLHTNTTVSVLFPDKNVK